MTVVAVAQGEVAGQQSAMQAGESALWALIGLDVAIAIGALPPLAAHHRLWWLPLVALGLSLTASIWSLTARKPFVLGPSARALYEVYGREDPLPAHQRLLSDLLEISRQNQGIVRRGSQTFAISAGFFLLGVASIGPIVLA